MFRHASQEAQAFKADASKVFWGSAMKLLFASFHEIHAISLLDVDIFCTRNCSLDRVL